MKFLLEGKVLSLRVGLGLAWEQRDTELCDRWSLTLVVLYAWCWWQFQMSPLMIGPCALVQTGPDPSLVLLLLQRTGHSPGAARRGGDVCSRGLLAGVKAVNKSVHSATLVLLFQIFPPNCLFCVTCGFLVPLQPLRRLTDMPYLQLNCGSWPNSELNQS